MKAMLVARTLVVVVSALVVMSACATTTSTQIAGAPLVLRGASLEVLEDGALRVHGGPGYAYVDRALDDVAVRAEVVAKGNSGIFVRGAHPFVGFYPSGPEAQIEAAGDPWATGALYGVAASRVKVEEGAAVQMCVAVKGTRVIVVVNDMLASEGTVEGRAGFVALQAHDPFSEVTFRRLRIRPIAEDERVEDACATPW